MNAHDKQDPIKNPKLGYACAITAQLIWGAFPIYLHFLKGVPAPNIVAHRAIWSFVLLLGLMGLTRVWSLPMLPRYFEAKRTLSTPSILIACFVAAILISINWCVFVWAANHDHKIDASLGYYICPQVMVLLGVIFLGERLGRWQWVGVAIVAGGVALMAQSSTGEVWISLLIAASFGLYAMCKKQTSMSALGGLTFETGFLTIPAIVFLGIQVSQGSALFGASKAEAFLLLGCGVSTILPLALYAAALKHIPLSTVGFLQFIGPTLQFALGVFIFDEPFERVKFLGFLIVWTGVVLFLFSQRAAIAEKKVTLTATEDNVG